MPKPFALERGSLDPPPRKGAIWYVPQIQERLGTLPNGKRVTKEWILENVAPTKRFRVGKYPCWHEADIEDWIAQQRESA